MAVRIPWDKYETAILIEACENYNSGRISLKEAVRSVSSELRKRAQEKGLVVDEVFRNENGISMQFTIMNGLITNKTVGLHAASKLFIDMSELYKNDRSAFDEVLRAAKGMGESKKTTQEQFFSWLINQLSPAQLSDMYIVYYEMDKCLIKEGLLNSSLFTIFNINTMENLVKELTSNSIFINTYKADINKYCKAIKFYHSWLLENKKIFENSNSEKIVKEEKTSKKLAENITLEMKRFDEHGVVSEEELYKKNNKKETGLVPVKMSTTEGFPKPVILEQKELFDIWLERKGIQHSDIMVIHFDMSRLSKMMINMGIVDKELYGVKSQTLLKEIIDQFRQSYDYLLLEKRLQKQYNETLNYYLEFIVSKDNNKEDREWNLKTFLDSKGLKYIDMTDKNGCFWIIGGKEIEDAIMECQKHDILFRFCKNGGNVTHGLDAWWADKIPKSFALQQENIESVSISYIGMQEKLAVILEENFEEGFRVGSIIFMNRFRGAWKDKYGEELSLTEEQMSSELSKIGILRDDRIYMKREEDTHLLQGILDGVINVLREDATCVCIDAVYEKYQIELADVLHIYNEDVLADTLIDMSRGKIIKKNGFLCFESKVPDIKGDVISMLKQSSIPMTYDELNDRIWYISLNRIKQVMVTTKSIVQVAPKSYFYAPNFPISEDEREKLIRLIKQELEFKTYITDVEMKKIIDEKLPSVSIDIRLYTTYGLRNCLGYILRNEFSFKGPIISELGREISIAEVFSGYCREREQITVDELKQLADEMDTGIYWDAVYEETVRVSEELFINDKKVFFTNDEIDEILESMCEGKYIALKDIGLFLHFPAIGIAWNEYVLESFVYRYSKKFHLIHAGFSASGVFGAIVRMDSDIKDYGALIMDVLVHTNEWSDKKTALEYLVVHGYQQRKRYSNIDKVVLEAKLIREKNEIKG